MIIIDTNVVSELMRAAPAPSVAAWAVATDSQLFLTTLTVAEIRYGIARLPDGARKQSITSAADRLLTTFSHRIVSFDLAAANSYGDLVARREARGCPISVFDAQIAAVCQAHNASLATRNIKDFEATGIAVIDPWNA
jgi:predicted nucleic acid-binding protein